MLRDIDGGVVRVFTARQSRAPLYPVHSNRDCTLIPFHTLNNSDIDRDAFSHSIVSSFSLSCFRIGCPVLLFARNETWVFI